MVTASHNPKEDNGYKVYFDNGAQIISPHDSGIARSIEENLVPDVNAWDIDGIERNELVTDSFDETSNSYYADLKGLHFCSDEWNSNPSFKFVYTAMHGVGYEFSVRAFKEFGLAPFIPVILILDKKSFFNFDIYSILGNEYRWSSKSNLIRNFQQLNSRTRRKANQHSI